jgi:hypothetical protein
MTTEAGKRLLDWLAFTDSDDWVRAMDDIALIEAEAREQAEIELSLIAAEKYAAGRVAYEVKAALAEAAERVRGLPCIYSASSVAICKECPTSGCEVEAAAVLAILED